MGVTDATPTGIHGRLRQRVVAIGGGRPSQGDAAHFTKDAVLRRLVKSGAVTVEQLQQAVRGCSMTPSSYVWMTGVNAVVLARADCVFLAEYGRFPTDDGDFLLNGSYHKICRGLEYDWHYYDPLLARLHWDKAGHPYARSEEQVRTVGEVCEVETRRGNAWAFGLALAAGLGGGPAIAFMLAGNVSRDFVSTVSVFGVIWLLVFAGLLRVTLPRRVRHKDTVLKCGRCGRRLNSKRRAVGCPACGALFVNS